MNRILSKEGYIIKKSSIDIKKLNTIKNELTVKPFQTFKSIKQKEETYTVYTENDDYICIPKFYGIKKFGQPDENHEPDGVKVNYKFNFKPRKTDKIDQNVVINQAIETINTMGGGLICAGCGAGKTFMGLYIAHHFKVKTLIIVHKNFLLNQWIEKINEYSNAKVGKIQCDVIDIEDKDIVIGTVQSIAKDKYDSDIFMDFGMVIFDEAHHAPSKYFSRALPIINCKRTLALSATPTRSDKMEKILYWYMGDILYKAPPNKNDKVQVNIYNYNLNNDKFKESYMRNGDVNRPLTINNIIKIKKRNKFIVNILCEIMEEEGRQCLILSDRIEHLEKLKEYVDKKEKFTTAFYTGRQKQKDLDKASTVQILFGSYGIASEGLDIPTLNTLFLVTPRSKIEQSAGRIIRKVGDISPLIVDFTDMLPSFKNQGMVRRRLYKKLDYQITLFDVEDNEIIESYELQNKKNINNINDILEAGILL